MSAPASPAEVDRAPCGPLTGTAMLVRFALRRDRLRLVVWVAAIGLTVVATAASFPPIYADPADRQARAALMSNPAAIVMGGPEIGLEDYTYGAMMTNEMLGFMAVFVALMSILLVVRHTRADEETGRTELVRANVVGRHAPLAAALVVVLLANVAVALAVATGLAGLRLESIDAAGSWLFAAALAAVGVVFAAVAAVTAQVTEHARGASGMAGLALGAAYALRAVGDVGAEALSWLSPIGWAQRTLAYVDDRWWPLLPAVLLTPLLVAVAVSLGSRRDVGAGLRASRPGPARAAERLASPLGLAVRLHRASLVAWVASFFVFGLLFGAVLAEVEGFAAELEALGALFEGLGAALADAFAALIVSILAMTAAVYAVLTTLRARSEETAGRAEPLLVTPTSRTRWLASHASVAAVGSVVVLLAGALGTSLSGAVVLGDAGVVPALLGAAAVYAAPLVLTVGVAVALFGLVPSASAAAWLVVVYALVVGMLGGLLGLPDWTLELSPFGVVPLLPVERFEIVPVLGLLALAAVLLAAGFAGFRRRDLTTTA